MKIKMTSKKEYGDYQTPADFAEKCVKYLKENFHFLPEMIIEPTCGVGNFLASAGKFLQLCRPPLQLTVK